MALGGSNLVDLRQYTDADRIIFFDPDVAKGPALQALALATAQHPAVADAEAFVQAIFDRERVSSTGIGGGIAVPHAKLPSISDFIISVGISATGIDFAAKDSKPVHVLVMIAASDRERDVYLKVLATVAGRLKVPDTQERIRTANDADSVLAALLG